LEDSQLAAICFFFPDPLGGVYPYTPVLLRMQGALDDILYRSGAALPPLPGIPHSGWSLTHARDGAYKSLGKRIRFEEDLTENERRRWFGVVTAMQLSSEDTLRWFDFDSPVMVINGQNIIGQRRKPENPHYLHAAVAAQI